MAGRKGAKERFPYEPDYATEPGEILQETVDALGMTQKELAARTGYSPKHINLLISGKARVTPEAALRLQNVTGVPAHFWNNLECQFQERKARLLAASTAEEQVGWLKEIPTSELIKRGVLPASRDKVELVRAALRFFQVASVEVWRSGWSRHRIAFRKAAGAGNCTGEIAAWVRLAELEAEKVSCQPFNTKAFQDSLEQARQLTTTSAEDFVPHLRSLLAESGVALALVPEIRGSRVNGAARWFSDTKAMIALNLRGKFNDRFWFTFFHEAGHLLNDDRTEVFIDVDYADDPRERGANGFAAEMLIPSRFSGELKSLKSKAAVREFASRIGIHPGIVVGRMQYEQVIPFSHMNDLKCRFQWAGDL